MDGQVTVLKDDLSVPLNKGEIAFIQPGSRHNILIEDKNALTFVISFTCVCKHLRNLQNTVIPADDALLSLFRKMRRELERSFQKTDAALHLMHFTPNANSPIGAEQMICCYLEQAVILMLRSVTMRSGKVIRTGHFQEALQNYLTDQVHTYIREHIYEPLRVDALAAHFHYSRGRLSTILKGATGMSLGEIITYERIREAKKLLTEGEKSVAQIAELLCFASPQYFSYKFSKEVGCPPSQYAEYVTNQK
jgi:AraC-like DNA-binding protein